MIHPLDQYRLFDPGQQGQQPIIPNSKFVIVRPSQPFEKPIGIGGRFFKPVNYTTGNLAVQPMKVAD
jgi:hypothetical protein